MRFLAPLALITIALVLAGCGGSTASLGSDDVAVVGSQTITKEQFQSLMARAEKSYKQQKRTFPKPGTTDYETLKGQAITFLVQRAEFADKASEMGIDVTDDQIDKRIARLKKQYYGGSDKKYRDALAGQGLTEEKAKDEIRAQLISEALFKKITDKVKVTATEIRAYFDSHKTQYGQAESRVVRHILVPNKALADRLYTQLQGGANFAKLAKQYSKDPGSAANGGKLTVSRGQTVPEFDKTAFALKKNELSKPVKTQYGYHIIQALSAIKPATTSPFKQVEPNIRQQLEQQRKNDAMTTWVNDAKKNFCSGSSIKYQVGYKPNPDPCLTATSSTATTG